MKTLAVGVVFVFVASPLAGVVVLFARIPTADLAAGFLALAVAGSIALVVAAGCWGAARIVEAWQPKAALNIDQRIQIAMDKRQQATLQAPRNDEQLTPAQAYTFGQEARR